MKSLSVSALLFGLVVVPLALADAPPVDVGIASQQPISRIVNVSGTVTSPSSAVLSPAVAGLVETMAVDAGDRVATGDMIVSLDAELAALELERMQAVELQARTALEDARRRLREAEEIGTSRGIARTEIASLRAEVAGDEATLTAASVAARQQAARVARHAVRAPFAGVVSQRLAEVGEWVNPGDPLLELVATEGLRFDVRVPQENFPGLTEATPVTLLLDAYPGREVDARIQSIVPIKDPTARTFLVRIVALDAAALEATPGMSVRAQLYIDTGREGVVVSRDALLRYPDGRTTVWELEAGAELPTVSERQVTVGVEFDELIEIRQGLAAGATVVTRGNEALQQGQTVQPRQR